MIIFVIFMAIARAKICWEIFEDLESFFGG